MTVRTTITCTLCSAIADVPDDGVYAPLWDAGWRWIGTQELFSCPPCPPMIVVAADGAHQRGPGVEAAAGK